MVDIWVTSDTHFGHANIIKYCNRPFSSIEEMDEVMIARWNEVVLPHHHVYHLGDVAMSQMAYQRCVPRLQGHKRLILGNHDNQVPMRDHMKYFQKILLWRLFKPLILTHVPINQDNFGKAAVNVHGHIHKNPCPAGPYINVSVEVRDYRPVHLDELVKEAERIS